MTTPCPDCGVGTLDEYPATAMIPWHLGFHCVTTGRGLEYRPAPVTVIACSACEYVRDRRFPHTIQSVRIPIKRGEYP